MYQPKHFQEIDPKKIEAVIHENGFACVITEHAGEITVDHLPLFLKNGRLVGHIAYANPLRKRILDVAKTLVVFSGPHAYVSPTLYVTEAQVPTWNYVAVHIEGKFRPITDEAATTEALRALSEKYEAKRDPKWTFEIPEWGQGTLLKQILAFEIEITKTTAKFKLSQNRDAEDRASVIQSWENSPFEMERALSVLMKS